MSSVKVNEVVSAPSASIAECMGVLACVTYANMVVIVSSILSRLTNSRSERLSSSGVQSESSVSRRGREWDVW